MMIMLGVLIGIFALLMLRRLKGRSVDAAQRLYLKFCRKLGKVGLVRAEHEGAQDFAKRAVQASPQLADPITRITNLYLAVRYGGEISNERLQALRNAVSAFKL